jgi:hypothetical protein
VEVFGLIGVQKCVGIKPWNNEPYLIESDWCVVHIPTGHVIAWMGPHCRRARAVARELASFPEWERIPAGYKNLTPSDKARYRALVGQGFIDRVNGIIKRHWEASRG